MDGIILLIILIPLVIIALLISLMIRNGEHQRLLESLYDELKEVRKDLGSLRNSDQREKSFKIPDPITKEDPIIIPQPKAGKDFPSNPKSEPISPTKPQPQPQLYTIPNFGEAPPPVKKKRTETKNTDWEKFIGENLASKIGIAVLVLGIAFFVKYAIDKDWINEFGRVLIGLLSGAILIGLAHYFRNSYRSFSSVLVGGGLTVFYFSIAFAFHQYHLIGQTTAFIIMVVISGLGVILSLYYNRQELAILATIGGFITPFLVSTGQENYVALFTYLSILNSGLMVLAWFKRWPSINFIGLFFTTIIFGGWLIDKTLIDDSEFFPYKDALLFGTLFYALFVIMNIINTLRLKEKFRAFDFIVVLSTNFLYYWSGMTTLNYWNHGKYQSLFTLLLGVVNLILALSFWRKKSADRNFVALLVGLALTFISLAVAIEFNGDQVVLFWAAEAVILYWLFLRTKYELLRMATFIISTFMLVGLLIVWSDVYLDFSESILPIVFHKGFITSLGAGGALFTVFALGKGETPFIRNTFLVLGIAVAYAAGAFEIDYQFSTRFTSGPLHIIYMQVYTFLVVLLLFYLFRKAKIFPQLKLLGSITCFVFYLWGVSVTFEISELLLTNNLGKLFTGHWIAVILLMWVIYDLIIYFFKQKDQKWIDRKVLFTWTVVTGIILLLSVEMYQVMFWTNYRNELDWPWWENLYYKAGLSMLWGLCSFGMMWLGMKNDFQPLRIVSLTLFTITVLKLFLFDIRNIPPGGKIVAFILLGILLLAVSFMYQRLKKLIIDNRTE